MWDQLRWYLFNVVLKKYAPLGVMAAFASLGAIMMAHAGILESKGITYGNWPINFGIPPTGPCIVIELDTLSKALITGIVTLSTMAIAAIQHHATGTPTLAGGNRSTDPPAKEAA